ncbi:MAG: hypothetical protein ABIR01_05295 [Candidatus Eisenbacteria bacterium]
MASKPEMSKVKTLHEAIVVCMVRAKRSKLTTARLAQLNARWELWRRPQDKAFPEPWQVFLRANQKAYRWLFEVDGNESAATVTLKVGWDSTGSNL